STHTSITEKSEVMKNMEKLLWGNTLIESLEENVGQEGGDDLGTENVLVVAFYLVTREAGLFFQNLANVVAINEKEAIGAVDVEALKTLSNHYFHALLNLKHLGSLDRIS